MKTGETRQKGTGEEERSRKEETERATFSDRSQAQGKGQDAEAGSSDLIPTGDIWNCCECGSGNLIATVPDTCSVCGHPRCDNCLW